MHRVVVAGAVVGMVKVAEAAAVEKMSMGVVMVAMMVPVTEVVMLEGVMAASARKAVLAHRLQLEAWLARYSPRRP